jgi:ABC-type branched-subunit amino acid transport system ATPase component
MSLQLEKVIFGYSADQPVLNGIDLTLEAGKIYVLMGANGAGKSTLFNVINGYLKGATGEIRLNGLPIAGLKPYVISRSGIARTFQDNRLAPSLSVAENILLAMKGDPTDHWLKALLPRSLYRSTFEQMQNRLKVILDTFFLSEAEHQPAGNISYGQQKLLLLACAYANDPSVMLLDEPVSGINIKYREQITGVLRSLKAAGTAILVIEHVTDFIDEIADHIYFLTGGKLRGYDGLNSFRADPFVIQYFF